MTHAARRRVDYFGARYYRAYDGRWLTPDYSADPDSPQPIPFADLENPQSLNLYSYVLNNPATNTDPDGHWCWFGHLGNSCSSSPKLPVKEGAVGAAAADGTLGSLDTQAILDGLRSDADAVVSGAADFAGTAVGTFGAVLAFSKPLNPGEDQEMAKVREQLAKAKAAAAAEATASDSASADSLIPGRLKASPSYHSELGGKSYGEIKTEARAGNQRARQMKKLIEQSKRLMGKTRG